MRSALLEYSADGAAAIALLGRSFISKPLKPWVVAERVGKAMEHVRASLGTRHRRERQQEEPPAVDAAPAGHGCLVRSDSTNSLRCPTSLEPSVKPSARLSSAANSIGLALKEAAPLHFTSTVVGSGVGGSAAAGREGELGEADDQAGACGANQSSVLPPRDLRLLVSSSTHRALPVLPALLRSSSSAPIRAASVQPFSLSRLLFYARPC